MSNSNAPPTVSLSQSYGPSSSSRSGPAQNQSSTASDDSYLDQASQLIDYKLSKDSTWSAVGDTLGSGSSFDYISPPSAAFIPFQKRRIVSLPDQLFESYTTTAHCTMGLLPEIERAWVTIDNRLLLWDWADGSSFATFDSIPSVILSVGLVLPRPGVFVDQITHLLVLCSVTHITLVGIGFAPTASDPPGKKEVTFYLTGLSVPTDGMPFSKVRGTKGGRIFLTTSSEPPITSTAGTNSSSSDGDGCVYELAYQATEGWFVKRCSLNNLTRGGSFGTSAASAVLPSFLRGLSALSPKDQVVDLLIDDERGLLYTLQRGGVIEMFELPSTNPSSSTRFDGPPRSLVKSGDVLQAARMACKTPALEASGLRIVVLQTVGVSEGEKDKVALVAVTNTGVRIYFSHQRRFPSYSSYSSRVLEVFHVRPPPISAQQQQSAPPPPAPSTSYHSSSYGQQPPHQQQQLQQQQQQQQPNEFAFKNIQAAHYASGGLFLASNNRSDEFGVLFVCAPDHSPLANSSDVAPSSSSGAGALTSHHHPQQQQQQQQQRFAELPAALSLPGQTWSLAEITPASLLPPARGKTGLNELAMQFTAPRREWVVLTDCGATVVARMRPVDTLVEVLEASGIGGASGGGGGGGEVGLFFQAYGPTQTLSMLLSIAAGNSRLSLPSPSPATSHGASTNGFTSSSRSSLSVAEQAKGLIMQHGGKPSVSDRGGWGGANQGGQPKIELSYKHDALAFYLARLLRPIWTERITIMGPTGRQVANVAEPVLTSVQRDLISLRTFVESEQHLFSLPQSGEASRSPLLAQAYTAEHTSLSALRLLLTQSVEAISFVLLLIDYQISDIIASCSPEVQGQLLGLSYQDLLTKKEGREVAKKLVTAVINQQIGRQLSVDAISDTLQQRCGSFCSSDDVLLYKAEEAIGRAKGTHDASERTESLRESLRLFIKAAKHLGFEKLRNTCDDYNQMRYPLGSIDLAINCAHEWDTADRAVSYWLDGCPSGDSRAQAYETRKSCNELVFKALEHMDNALNEASNPNQMNGPSYAEVDGLRTNAYNKALSIKDEFFHFALYDWYLSRRMLDQLLEIRTPYLETYLSQEPTTQEKSDLLWQFYVRTSRYAAAAAILAQLAETAAFPLALTKRVEYLSLAVGNAKSQAPSTRGDAVQFLTDVEEKLEVAQVQIEIFRAIEESDLRPEEKDQWLEKAEDRLFTISELYSEFAEPLQLLEIVLLIFHVSDHRDPFLVTATWEAILARAREDSPDRPVDALSVKITELGRRFHTSDVAFPLPVLANMLEEFSYENRAEGRPGWAPLAFHEAGVPWDVIFAVYDELLTAKVPPWHNPAGLTFLATDAAVLLETWLDESSSMHVSSPYAVATVFPATEVDTAVGKWLMGLASASGAASVVSRLNEIQRQVRSRF